jgi:hypothetical protein
MTAGHVFIPPTSATSRAAITLTDPVPHGSIAVVADDGSVHVMTPEEFIQGYGEAPEGALTHLTERVRSLNESGRIPLIIKNPEDGVQMFTSVQWVGDGVGSA